MNAVKIPRKRMSKEKQVPLRKDLMAVTGGDMIAALVLKQMMYWTEQLDDLDQFILEENQRLAKHGMEQVDYSEGWIYKSHRQMREELFNCVSEDTIGRAFTKLTGMGLFQTRRNPKFQYDRTLQYRLDLVLLRRLLREAGFLLADFTLDSGSEIDLPIPHGAESSPLIAGAIPESINIEVSSSLRSEETTPTPLRKDYEPAQEEFFPQQPNSGEAKPRAKRDTVTPPRTSQVKRSISTKKAIEVHNLSVALVAEWNSSGLPRIVSMTPDRMKKLEKAMELPGFLEIWKAAIAFCAADPFYNGSGPRSPKHANWRFTIDEFLAERFFVRIAEKLAHGAVDPDYDAMARRMGGR